MNSSSLKKLATCHPDIQRLAHAVDEVFKIHCVCGYRDFHDQEVAFRSGKSQLKPGESKHNKKPAMAGDFVPGDGSKVDWEDIPAFEIMCLTFEQKADELGIKIRLGRDFSFKDYPHFELLG